jgi:protein arginine kinase
VVVSSRLRLARNISNRPFPLDAGEESKKDILNGIQHVIDGLEPDRDYHLVFMNDLNSLQESVIQERRLGSVELTEEPLGGIVFDSTESLGFLVNEEDHFRIQSLQSGYDLQAVHKSAKQLESSLNETYDFAYDDEWGYLTACPTNLGTGMRASVLLHLPGLIMQEEIQQVLKAVANLGLTVRGYYGEGTESQGFYLQLSNQVTLGRSTKDLIDSLRRVTERLIDKEREARHELFEHSGVEMEDKVWRAYGTLRNARKIGSGEALRSLSLLRLGIDAGQFSEITMPRIDQLTMRIQPGHLNLSIGERLSSDDRDTYRARVLRKTITARTGELTTEGSFETEYPEE